MSNKNTDITLGDLESISVETLGTVSGGSGKGAFKQAADSLGTLSSSLTDSIKSTGDAVSSLSSQQ
jgi:hypothetical protein